MQEKFKDVRRNEYGYYELIHPPTAEERKKVFEQEYFQNSMSSYEQAYTEMELKYFNYKLEQKEMMLRAWAPEEKEHFSLLDIGCGEGFALAYFKSKGFFVQGIDFSIYGIEKHNPQVKENMLQGDCEELLPQLIKEGKKFDIINMDSVLDMAVHPKNILNLCRSLLEDTGIMLIKVANNYSLLQQYLLAEKKLSDTYWLDKSGHPSYFNRTGLINLLEALGYQCLDTFGESFIDFHLFNENTNYYEKRETGKSCYLAKIELENLMHEISPEKTLETFRLLGEMGFGREIIGIFKKK